MSKNLTPDWDKWAEASRVTLECSACGRPCADVVPGNGPPVRVTATCPWGCRRPDGTPDGSFPRRLPGPVRAAGHAVKDKTAPDGFRELTRVADVRWGDPTHIETVC